MLELDLAKIVKELKKDDLERWSRRVDRDKYYDEEYRPKTRERREVEDLAKVFSSTSLPKSENHERIHKCLLPPINKRKTVVLKREPVIYKAEGNEMIVELILLNHSFIVAFLPEKKEDKPLNEIFEMTKKFTQNVNSLLGKKAVENCFKLSSIIGIVEGDDDSNTFTLIVQNNDKQTVFVPQITCHTSTRKHAWLDAFKLTVMENCQEKKNSLNIVVKTLHPEHGWHWKTPNGDETDETIMPQETTLTESLDEDLEEDPGVVEDLEEHPGIEFDLVSEEKSEDIYLDDLSFGSRPSSVGGLPPQVMEKLISHPDSKSVLRSPKIEQVIELMMNGGAEALEKSMKEDQEIYDIVTKLNAVM